MFFKRSHRHTAFHEYVLGTSLELHITADSRIAGPEAEKAVLAEVDRLSAIFNAYDASSELSRWQTSNHVESPVSPELAEVLGWSEHWKKWTGGAYNPGVEVLTRLWAEHAKLGTEVPAAKLREPLGKLAEPLWHVSQESCTATRLTQLPCTLNAIAKGYIIDRAARAAIATSGVRQCLVNIGGDLCHLGDQEIRAGVSDPFSDAENAAPAAIVKLKHQGLATSGNYRRGFRIGDCWYSHVLDPRTGWPVEHLVSVSVLAADAMTADVLATAFCVLEPAQSVDKADEFGVGVFLIDAGGNQFSNSIWRQYSLSVPERAL